MRAECVSGGRGCGVCGPHHRHHRGRAGPPPATLPIRPPAPPGHASSRYSPAERLLHELVWSCDRRLCRAYGVAGSGASGPHAVSEAHHAREVPARRVAARPRAARRPLGRSGRCRRPGVRGRRRHRPGGLPGADDRGLVAAGLPGADLGPADHHDEPLGIRRPGPRRGRAGRPRGRRRRHRRRLRELFDADIRSAGWSGSSTTAATTRRRWPPTTPPRSTAVRSPAAARFSVHSWGKAVDINPVENPYVKGDIVLPEAGAAVPRPQQLRPGGDRRRATWSSRHSRRSGSSGEATGRGSRTTSTSRTGSSDQRKSISSMSVSVPSETRRPSPSSSPAAGSGPSPGGPSAWSAAPSEPGGGGASGRSTTWARKHSQ